MRNKNLKKRSIVLLMTLFVLFSFNIENLKAQRNLIKNNKSSLIGTVSGVVFNDLFNNGTLDSGETGVGGVVVSAYDAAGVLQGSTVTLSDGKYLLNAAGAGPYRIEFTNFPSGFTTGRHTIGSDIGSPRTAVDSGTDVQFVADGDTSNVNLALFDTATASTNPPISPDDILQNGYAIYSKITYDSSEPTLVVRDITQLGTLIDDPANRVPNDMSAFAPVTHTWSAADFGGYSVYGIAIDRVNGTIYTAVSPYYGFDRTPKVFKIDGRSGAVTLLATLPNNVTLPNTQDNKGFGVGAIEYDQIHDQLFVANMDDGIIYRLDAETGNVLSIYDPRNADSSGANLPSPSELVTAIGYHKSENRLYYSMWDHDDANSKNSTMFSVGLSSSGDFNTATNTEEFSIESRPVPADDGFYYPPYAPVTDIDFNDAENRVLVNENSVGYDPKYNPEYTFVFAAHNSVLFEYAGESGDWKRDLTKYNPNGLYKYELGDQFQGINSRGGAAWGYKSIVNGSIVGNEEYIASTSDTIDWDPDNNHYVYGITFMPSTGGSDDDNSTNGANSVAIDLDNDIAEHDKWVYGDLDIRRWQSPPLEIGNRIWSDADDDGIQDANEFGLSGITVNLYRPGFGPDGIAGNPDDNDPVATTLTNTGGEYYFPSIFTNAGYEIRLDNPADYASGGVLEGRTLVVANAGSDTVDSDASNVTNPVGSPAGTFPVIAATTPAAVGTSNPSYDFGFSGTGVNNFSIGNRVWFDTNNNGVIDAAESGVNNVSVSLFADADANGSPDDVNAPLATVTTNSGGYYMFASLADGNYIVRVNPSNFQSGGRLFNYKNSTTTETNPNSDVDLNDNGLDGSDKQVVGVLSGTITLGPGFSEPIGENEPSSYGSGSMSGNLSQDDLSNATVDFGFQTLSLSGMIFYDPENTAVQTPYGVPGVPVRLYDANGNVVAETATAPDGSGEYRFDGLDEGTYTVRVVPFLFGSTVALNSPDGGVIPDPVIDPDNNAESDDNGVNGTGDFIGYLVSQPVTLSYGDEPVIDNVNGTTSNPTVDFGLMPSFAIGNRVWTDSDEDGVIDDTEAGFSGVSVSLFADTNGDGTPDDVNSPLSTLTTDAAGYYRFTQLYPGNYVVRINPSNFQLGGVLYGATNSSGVSGGNSDVDLADHGVDGGIPSTNGVLSQTVTLNFDTQEVPQAAEPAGETQPANYGTGSTDGISGLDTAENMTIDFGFYFSPTVAAVEISGKVLSAKGFGLPNQFITITGGNLSAPITVRSNSFGNYKVEGLQAGETYVITINSKKYNYENPTRVINMTDNITGLDFQAQ